MPETTLMPVLALAQDAASSAPPPVPVSTDAWGLFVQSFDFFTIVLVLGSVAAGAYIFRALVQIRPASILPPARVRAMREMAATGRFRELEGFVADDATFLGPVIRAAFRAGGSKGAMRDAAELSASEQIADLFRKIEPLNVIGNLGPLVGLAGTVWGMILAFTTLGQAGGEANPASLSVGISKALFHTLLGLCLAIPALLVFGYYRGVIDRLANRAMVIAGELVEQIPEAGTDGAADRTTTIAASAAR